MSLAFIPPSFTHGDYGFRKADGRDLARIHAWLAAPHLSGWWVPGEDELSAALAGEAGQTAYLVDHHGLPFAFLYIADPVHDPILSGQVDYPAGTVRFDQFVGDGDMIGHGHGVKFIKAFVAAMQDMPGITRLITLPAKDNMFAQRTYSQAGFRGERTIDDHHAMRVLMSRPLT